MKIQLPDTRRMEVALKNDTLGIAQLFVLRGLGFEQEENLIQAIDDYETALRISPGNAQILYRRGVAFSKKGDLDRAIATFDEALRIIPEFVDVLYARGNVWWNKRRFDRAIEDYDAVLRLNPSDEQAINGREAMLRKEIAVSA